MKSGAIWCVACSAVCGTGAALAQEGRIPDTRPPVEEVIARLDSPLFVAREQAVAELLGRRDVTLAQAEGWLSRAELTPEQRLRLERVAIGVFRRGPRAALGIRFQPERDNGVRVQEVFEQFPAAVLLRPGDDFVEIDGVAIRNQAACRAAILSHAPGETIRLTLRRGGERVEVEAPLGSFEGLAAAVAPSETDMLAAWTLRRARDGSGPMGAVVEPVVGASPEGVERPEPGSRAWEQAFATADAPRGLRVGGQSRLGIDLSLTQLAAMDASRSITLEDLDDVGEADLAVQISLLRERRGRVLDDMEHIAQLIDGGNLDRGQRAMMRRRLEDEQDMLEVIEEQIRVLDQARRAKP